MLKQTMNKLLLSPAVKPVVWCLALLPLAWLVLGIFTDNLGANPAEALIRSTGDWALRVLCITLAITPLRQITGWNSLARLRRLIGLFAFFYVLLHVLSYFGLDMGFNVAETWNDVVQRPFILVGALAALLLLALTITSPRAMVRAMGGRNWQRLHRCIHVAAWLALLHFYWMRSAKNNEQEVWVYVAIVLLLQAWRLGRYLSEKRAALAR